MKRHKDLFLSGIVLYHIYWRLDVLNNNNEKYPKHQIRRNMFYVVDVNIGVCYIIELSLKLLYSRANTPIAWRGNGIHIPMCSSTHIYMNTSLHGNMYRISGSLWGHVILGGRGQVYSSLMFYISPRNLVKTTAEYPVIIWAYNLQGNLPLFFLIVFHLLYLLSSI